MAGAVEARFFSLVKRADQRTFPYDCSGGQSIHAYTKEQIPYWLNCLDDLEQVASVKLTSLSRAVIEGKCYRVNWAVVSQPVPVHEFIFGRYNLVALIWDFPFAIRYIRPQQMTQKLLAIKVNPAAIQAIFPPAGEPLLDAVRKNGLLLRYGERPDAETCLVAVGQAPLAIAYVPEYIRTGRLYLRHWQTLCDTAIAGDGLALQFVEPKTMDRCRIAVANNGYALKFCPERTTELCWLAIRQNPNTLWLTPPEFRRMLEVPPVRIGEMEIVRRKLRHIPYRQILRSAYVRLEDANRRSRPSGDQGLSDLHRW